MPSKKGIHAYVLALTWGITALTALSLAVFYVPPSHAPNPRIVYIKEGETISQVAFELEQENVVKSAFAFEMLAKFYGQETQVADPGYYLFDSTENTSEVVERILSGDYRLTPKKVLIYEGSTNEEIADTLQGKLVFFNKNDFLSLSEGEEGYLFPDTYYFVPTATAFEVYRAMRVNFEKNVEALEPAIQESGKTLNEIITMASLIQKEAWKSKDRRLISGVLWSRIDKGMKLQVDAVFPYIIGKNTFQLTYDDLTVDSPYNTYKYKGLPPGPIANPGLDAIEAALHPEKTKYVYYLADMRGTTHYAITYGEHERNIDRYLR